VFLHNKRLMYTVRVDQPDPLFANLLLEQFGGPNGELGAAMRYFTQAWNEPNGPRRSMLADIATEELSHLEMVGQALVLLMKGSPAAEVDKVEGDYLGDLLSGDHDKFMELSTAATSPAAILSGGGPTLTDSSGKRFTADWIDTIGEPTADLRSDIAAEARAKIVYERLIKQCNDPGLKDTLTFLMTREIAHQKMFEAALDAITDNFPPGTLAGDEKLGHVYVNDSGHYGTGGAKETPIGFEFAQANSSWGFDLDSDPVGKSADQAIL
jgi:Mn-containing catalase